MEGSTKSDFIRRVILIIIGAAIAAYALEAVLIPNAVIDGGVTGVSIMGNYLFNIPLGVLLFVLNLPFIYLGYKQVGKTFAIYSTIGIVALSISTMLMHGMEPILGEKDSLLVVLSGGVILGVGIGIVLRNGGALDGSEVLAVLLSRNIPFSVGDVILFINAFIFTGAGFIYGLESALYSAATYYIAKVVIDVIQVGLESSKSVRVISKKSRDIGQAIQDRLGRGVTYTHGTGGFSNEQVEIVSCIITRMEENKILTIIKEHDPSAFIVITEVAEVRGGSFKKRDIH
ncbi:YitT family protein [Metasolibacillus meyeri]|uniref:YitT family protein n=1 Tax=Metasolibacillus meyeri TaxID=1071052 RepID=A0AAW9NW06_9BACL|nr:YitT family protein [Metasolibacillus meyeri]MEC1179141.1 YitT family protein [Metasolibacillus meyeri]